MPLIAMQCLAAHAEDAYVHRLADLGVQTRICACGCSLAPGLSVGRGLTWFEEGRARVIEALGAQPITSHRQHEQAMKARGVEMATEWHASRKSTGFRHPPKPDIPLPWPQHVGIEL